MNRQAGVGSLTLESFRRRDSPTLLVIIGAMKSGTTSLFNRLSQHPEICPCSMKEPDFLTDEEHWGRGTDWYFSLWDAWAPHQHTVALEASTSYTKLPGGVGHPEAAARLAELDREHDLRVELLYLIRDPMERIESHITHAWAAPWGPDPDDEQQMTRWMLWYSMYAAQLEPFEPYFSERIHVRTLDQLVNEPESLLREVCSVAGIDDGFRFRHVDRADNTSGDRLLRSRTWEFLDRLKVTGFRHILPEGVREWLKTRMGRPLPSRYRIPEDEARFLAGALTDDLRRLRDRYDVDVQSWIDTWREERGVNPVLHEEPRSIR